MNTHGSVGGPQIQAHGIKVDIRIASLAEAAALICRGIDRLKVTAAGPVPTCWALMNTALHPAGVVFGADIATEILCASLGKRIVLPQAASRGILGLGGIAPKLGSVHRMLTPAPAFKFPITLHPKHKPVKKYHWLSL